MLNPFVKAVDPYMLVVGMASVKMGDRLIQVGCEHGGRLAAIAAKVGLTGQAVAVAPDERSAARARKGAAAAGVLVEIVMARPIELTAETGAFDIAVVDDTGGIVGALPPADQARSLGELARVLRPGGRALYIGSAPRSGLSAVFAKSLEGALFAASGGATEALAANGFKSAHVLAEREGLVFVEGIKPR